jgi:hypothetical protein
MIWRCNINIMCLIFKIMISVLTQWGSMLDTKLSRFMVRLTIASVPKNRGSQIHFLQSLKQFVVVLSH